VQRASRSTVSLWSVAITNAFFDDLADVLERAMAYSCPYILLGDFNIHLDVLTNPDTIKWQSTLDSYGLIQVQHM